VIREHDLDHEMPRRREGAGRTPVLAALVWPNQQVTLLGPEWARLGLSTPRDRPTQLADLIGRDDLADAVTALKRLAFEELVTFDARLGPPGAGWLRFWATLDVVMGNIRIVGVAVAAWTP
jgi:hypothetical protein